MKYINAYKALRLNYTRKGVLTWVKGRKIKSDLLGWQEILKNPDKVVKQQEETAQGNM